MSEDPLDAILQLALEEGALTRETLPEFGRALRERAQKVLGERVAALEGRVANLEREIAWRQEGLESLEAELSWRKTRTESLEAEVSWRKELEVALRAEAAGLSTLRDEAGVAHDRLLEHHRMLVRALAAQLDQLGSGPLWGLVRIRRRLREIAASLSGGVP